MTNLRPIFLTIALATVSMGSYAQTTDQQDEHHLKLSTEEQTSSDKTSPTSTQDDIDKMDAMDNHLKIMREMHDKMTSAKTPEARQALKAEHMKVMKDGMGVMAKGSGMNKRGMMGKKEMMGNELAQHHNKMEKRIDQMQSMMQMQMSGMMGMHSDMGGMGHKHGGEVASGQQMQRSQMMEKRMEMMQSMMQMIIDTLEPVPAE